MLKYWNHKAEHELCAYIIQLVMFVLYNMQKLKDVCFSSSRLFECNMAGKQPPWADFDSIDNE